MGNEVFKTLTQATGLPEEIVEKELNQVLGKRGVSPEEVTVEDIRALMADYLREVIARAKDEFENGVWIEEEVPQEELGLEE